MVCAITLNSIDDSNRFQLKKIRINNSVFSHFCPFSLSMSLAHLKLTQIVVLNSISTHKRSNQAKQFYCVFDNLSEFGRFDLNIIAKQLRKFFVPGANRQGNKMIHAISIVLFRFY